MTDAVVMKDQLPAGFPFLHSVKVIEMVCNLSNVLNPHNLHTLNIIRLLELLSACQCLLFIQWLEKHCCTKAQ